jgi:hypothetical protein
MTTDKQDDQPATAAGACDVETAIGPKRNLANWRGFQAADQLAWSLDDSEDRAVHSWREVAGGAAGVLLICAAVAALLLLGRPHGAVSGSGPGSQPSAPVTVTSTVVTTSTLPPPEPPATPVAAPPAVTVTAAPKPAAAPPARSQDEQYLDDLHDLGLRTPNPQGLIAAAYEVCAAIGEGRETEQHVIAEAVSYAQQHPGGGIDAQTAAAGIRIVVQVYCPQYAQ